MKTKIKAQIVADSLSPQGERLTSLLVTFPRIILSEVNTHRMLSKNTSSSRAIPFEKMRETILRDPFIPIAWQKAHKGMQGTEYWKDTDIIYPLLSVGNSLTGIEAIIHLTNEWLAARDSALLSANYLNSEGVTKQLCNRLLEPWMWTTMLITGSKEGWDNFFNLRCPDYTINWYPKNRPEALEPTQASFKSKKQAIAQTEGECDNWTEEDWRKSNDAAAEIHIQALAEAIYDAMNESTPIQLEPGQWHIPFRDTISKYNLSEEDQVKVSVAMAARTSYTVIDDEKEINIDKMISLHDKLLQQDPPHSSPLEHCAKAMTDEEHYTFVKGKIIGGNDQDMYNDEKIGIINYEYYPLTYDTPISRKYFTYIGENINNGNKFGWCNNLRGFIPYRFIIDNKYGKN